MNKFLNLNSYIWGLFVFKAMERFSFYALKYSSSNYLMSAEGFALSSTDATSFIAHYNRIGLLVGMVLGLLCDLIGQKRALILGSIIVIAAHAVSHIHYIGAFAATLVLMNCASGFLRSSTIAMVNALTPEKEIDRTMTLFYQVFNFGVFIGTTTTGYIAAWFSYKIALLYCLLAVIIGHSIGLILNYKLLFSKGEFGVGNLIPDEEKNNSKISHSVNTNENKTDSSDQKHQSPQEYTWGRIVLGITLYLVLHFTFAYYCAINDLMDHFVPGWIHDHGTPYLFGFHIPHSTVASLNPLLVFSVPALIYLFRSQLMKRGWFKCAFTWSNVAIVVLMLGLSCLFGAERQYKLYGESTPLFFILHTILVTLGEIIFYPAILSAPALLLTPKLYGIVMTVTVLFSYIGSYISEAVTVRSLSNSDISTLVYPLFILGIGVMVINLIASRLFKGGVMEKE